MKPVQPFAARMRVAALVFVAALLVRLLALLELRGEPWNEILLGDASHFDAWGRRLAAGGTDAGSVFFQAPLYPYLLAAAYRVAGHAPDLVRLLQCVGGALAAALVADASRRLYGSRAGYVAGLLAALYAPAVWYDLQVEKTSLSLTLTAALMHFLVVVNDARTDGPVRRRNLLSAAVAGVGLGLLALLRENALVLAVPLGWALARSAGPGRRARGTVLGAAAAGLLACLLPVAVHNHAAGGVPLPTTANAGVNFWIGNGDGANGQYREIVPGRGHPDYEQADARRLAEEATGHVLGPAAVSRHWFARALREMGQQPAGALANLGRKVRLLAGRDEVMDSVSLASFQDASLVLRALGPIGFGLLLPLAAAGAVLAVRRGGAAPLLLAAGLLAVSILAFFVMGRFRLGLVPLLFPLAALAIVSWRDLARRPGAMAVLALAAALSWWPQPGLGDARAASAANLADEYLRRADFPAAERWAAQARRRAPGSAEAAYNLGLALRWQGRYAEAREPLQAAMRLQPAFAADCLAELGAIAGALGDPAAARPLLEQALRLRPGHEGALRYLAIVEQALAGPPAQAIPGR
jgi:tetratricopeptide (TPR) repeat protein